MKIAVCRSAAFVAAMMTWACACVGHDDARSRESTSAITYPTCPPEATTPDSHGELRNAAGDIRYCWPGEDFCHCDQDNDCYARVGYVACAQRDGGVDAETFDAGGACPPEPTTLDSHGEPRNAAGDIRYCWPGEAFCGCDLDNDCYARAGYVRCLPVDAGTPRDAAMDVAATACPPETTTLDSHGEPRNAAGDVRHCWPGEAFCHCDQDNDCYARAGYVPCSPIDAGTPRDAAIDVSTTCAREATTLDSHGEPRNAAGDIRYCWPGEAFCHCDQDNDCYARAGYAPCSGADAGTDAAVDVPPPDAAGCATGQALCPTTPFLNEPQSSYRCRALVAGRCPAADLIVMPDYILDDQSGHVVHITVETFGADAAELPEGCIAAPGTRRLLRFNYVGSNAGDDLFNVGKPNDADTVHFEFDRVHNHWHLHGWAGYELRTLGGISVGLGHKQSFCIEDNVRLSDTAGTRYFPPPRCEMFDPTTPLENRPELGLSPGWGDEYPANLRCQYVDMGPADMNAAGYVPDGYYDLILTANVPVNGTRLYRESNYGNNSATFRVHIVANSASGCIAHAGEPCAGGVIQCGGGCGP